METDKRQQPGKGTQAYKLLELIAISGEFPAGQIKRLVGGDSYKEKIIKAMKNKNLIRTYHRDKLRGYRLTGKAKDILLADNFSRFKFYLTGNADTNRIRSEIPRRIRLHRVAETYITMQNSDVAIFRDEKPDIFHPKGAGETELHDYDFPAFYSSREIKELGSEFVKIRGARTTGVLLAETGVFVVYNTNDALMKWEYKAEMRTKALMKTVLCQQRLPHLYGPEDVYGLILGKDMETAYQLLTSTGGVKRNYFVLDGNYENFFYLPNDSKGELILRVLCGRDAIGQLNQVLSKNLFPKEPGGLIDNDAIGENGEPVFFAYSFNLPRIVKFNSALQLYDKKGIIICFDFQYEVLRRFCCDAVDFQNIDFNKFKGWLQEGQ